MNTTKYLQTDSRWSSLGYPKSPCTIGNSGCGEVAICNAIIEMKQYQNYTPKTIQPYCKQYAAPSCDGTYFSGIPKMMKHYGLTEVKEHATMDSLWEELAKGDRIAIYLMGNRPGGSKRVHWSSSAHFITSVSYRYKDGEHQVYMKDSNSDSSLRNGWIGYATHLKGDVSRVWSGKLNGAKPSPTPTPTPTPTPSGKLVVDGVGGTATVKRMQEFFKTTQDGVIGGQNKDYAVLYPSLTSVSFGKGGSRCIVELQKWLGLSDPDGVIGKNTTKAWQRKLVALGYFAKNETIDGIFGVRSMKAWQECLNNNGKKKGGTPTPSPTPTKKKYKAIDVSEWQGAIDWKKVKADGVVGAIIRYADGDYVDKYFDRNMQNAKANGIHIGAYIFSRAKTVAQAEKEAERLYNACKKYSPDLPLYIDLEDNSLKNYANTVANVFIKKMKALGGFAGVYANVNWWNNYLTKVTPPARWVAQYYKECQYKGGYGMWQYSSDGSVKGISGRVDMDWLYVDYWNIIKPTPTPTKKGYQGKFPTYRLTKTNAQVIADAIKWAKWIAGNNTFHYGWGRHSHHNGCFFCGTQPSSKKNADIKDWQYTYCCNPFVGAAWAHGGGDATAYKMCHNGNSWDYSKGAGYDKSKLFNKLGKPSYSALKPGDVLCSDTHVALYIGSNKVVQAGHEDDNVVNSSSWKSSISTGTWNGWSRAYRYNGKVDCDRIISYGEVSDRVADLQAFLDWYFDGKVGKPYDGIYWNNTLKWCKEFQEREIGKGEGDGTVGPKTIEAMKKVRK